MNLFELATRKPVYRFPSSQGSLNIEDLWNLPLTSAKGASLQEVAVTISREMTSHDEENFVDDVPATDTVLVNKLDIVKHIIAVKKAENAAQRDAIANKAHNEKIDALIADKQDAALRDLPVEELQKLRKTA